MLRVARSLAVLGATMTAVAAVACGGPAAPPTTPTIASASATGDANLEVPSPPTDPRAVRCGVDDRPKSVLSENDEIESVPRSRGKRAAPMDVAGAPAVRVRPMPMPTQAPPRPRRPPSPIEVESPFPQTPPVQVPVPNPPNGPAPLHFSLGAVRLPTGPAAESDFVQALDTALAAFQSCEGRFTDDDEGDQNVALTMTKTGSPIEATPASPRDLTPFGTCIVERACALHIGTSNAPSKVVFALHATRQVTALAPPPDVPPPPAAPRNVIVSVVTGGDPSAPFASALKRAAQAAANACAPSSGLDNKHFTVLLSFPAGQIGPVGPLRTPVESALPPAGVMQCIVTHLGVFQAQPPTPVAAPVKVKFLFGKAGF